MGRWDAVDVTNPANSGYIERLTAARPQAGDIELGRDLMVGVSGQSLDELNRLDRSEAVEGRGSSCHDSFCSSRTPPDADVNLVADRGQLGCQG